MTAATPGQAPEPWRAAWMAFRDAAGFDTAADRAPDDELDAQWIAAWKAAAQAAIAAQDARPAPADGITPEYAAYEAYAMGAPDDLEFAEWEHVPAWQKRAIASAVQAGYEQRARQEARPAPGPLALQLIIAVDALRDIADEPHPGYGPERAAKALDDIGGQVNEDQLYDAAEREMNIYRAEITRITAERDKLRELAAEIIGEVSGWSRDPLDTDPLIADWSKRGGVPS